jgi:hypothetical protein
LRGLEAFRVDRDAPHVRLSLAAVIAAGGARESSAVSAADLPAAGEGEEAFVDFVAAVRCG